MDIVRHVCGTTTNQPLRTVCRKSKAELDLAKQGGRRESNPHAGFTIDRRYEEPWSGLLPTRIMVLTSELPRSTGASGRSAAVHLWRARKPAPEQMAKVSEFVGGGEVASL